MSWNRVDPGLRFLLSLFWWIDSRVGFRFWDTWCHPIHCTECGTTEKKTSGGCRQINKFSCIGKSSTPEIDIKDRLTPHTGDGTIGCNSALLSPLILSFVIFISWAVYPKISWQKPAQSRNTKIHQHYCNNLMQTRHRHPSQTLPDTISNMSSSKSSTRAV